MLTELINNIKSHNKIGVFSHIRPDGDALGSLVAFCLWLKKNDIEVYGFNDDGPSHNTEWLLEFFPIQKPDKAAVDECEAYVFLDGNLPYRFGRFGEYTIQTGKPCYLIDHHPDPDPAYWLSYSVESASSTAELVYEVISESGDLDLIDTAIAKSIYTGLMTDTGSFRFDSVTPRVHTIVADLLRRGDFKPNEVHELIYDHRTLNQMRLLGMVLESIELYADNQISTITVTKEMLEATGCTYDDTEGFIAYPLSINGVKAAVLFCELDDKVKLSLRSKSHILVNVWARIFGGGGHKRAAGAWHQGPLEKAKKDVIEAGEELLASVKS
ncbi:MAG TPA: bifunctional oligoribonuclease/PAP phosphatase NrnA [Balneolales bacterium]|nr:bifunctional oligoribonuclease/PAP phosphatase NrnA [Balneolales bacterium]